MIRVLLLLAFAALAAQMWRLQIVNSGPLSAAADRNRLRLSAIAPLRGVIYDRAGQPVAANAPSFVVSLTEADVPPGRRGPVLQETARLLGASLEEVERTVQSERRDPSPFTPITIRANVSRDVALQIEEHSWALPGISIAVDTMRDYPTAGLLAHVLGFVTLPSAEEYAARYDAEGYGLAERVGAAGVERVYESDLRGRPGERLVEVDAGGRPIREVLDRPADPGRNVTLTIDSDLQDVVQQILERKLAPGTSGVAVMMDPRNGEILAMVSLPSFDPNVLSIPDRSPEIAPLLSDSQLPMFNRAIAGQYAPGSTFKLVTGTGALEERLVDRNTRINCNGGLRIPNPYNPALSTFLPDWGVLGVLDFVQGLAQSCNVYFYTLGGGFGNVTGLGSERLARYARMVGYGQPTGIDLPSEASGRVPDGAWKQTNMGEAWLPGDTYNMAIGQGFVLATPLQVASVTNLLAMSGIEYRPHVVRAVTDPDGRVVRAVAPEVTRRAMLRPETLSAIRDGMLGVLDTEQSRAYRIPDVRVASKTGTAEFPGERNAQGILPTHGWFTAYAPVENPRVSVTVFVERGGGPTEALPPAMDMLREYFRRYPEAALTGR